MTGDDHPEPGIGHEPIPYGSFRLLPGSVPGVGQPRSFLHSGGGLAWQSRHRQHRRPRGFSTSTWRWRELSRSPRGRLRADAFNLPNHLNPSVPGGATAGANASSAALNAGSFGQITGDISGTSGLTSGDYRIVQVALKFVF